jgi:putative ABC transport system substrate-binding protein
LSRTIRLIVAALALAAVPPPAGAQPGKLPKIGILRQGSSPDPLVEAFRQALRDLGYVEGRNVSIEYRWAEGKTERLPALAAELVRLKVDVIVAGGADSLAARRVTATTPIVMPVSVDPVGLGLVASLARPGGNVTGLASLWDEMPGKWMELLREVLPGLTRVAVLQDPGPTRTILSQVRASEAAARSLNLHLHVVRVARTEDLANAFADVAGKGADALIVLASPFLFAHRARVVELAARHRLPVVYHQAEYVVGSGGLMSYGPDVHDLFRRAAGYVDRILKGAKPADLPIEQPTKFELVINLRTARTLGLGIPESLRSRADQLVR